MSRLNLLSVDLFIIQSFGGNIDVTVQPVGLALSCNQFVLLRILFLVEQLLLATVVAN